MPQKRFSPWMIGGILIVVAVIVFFLAKFYQPIYSYTINLPIANKVKDTFSYGPQIELAHPDFFNEVKQQFITDKTDFVEADLSSMTLRVYNGGSMVKEVKILTKGKDGSWWETPAGLYKIETKEKSHFSSFGQVYQPWSMAFQGNFFIHGWPYEPDGTAVSSTYSGGCIRLSDEDAQAVFDLVKVGTPVLVFEEDFKSDSFTYTQKQPILSAKQYLVADLKSNAVLMEKGSQDQVSIASIVKLVTALVSAEYINLDKSITVTKEALVPTSLPRLYDGQEVVAFHMLYPLLMESSNEAAEALAHSVGRNRFITLMNDKAKSLGMNSTTFSDPAGRDAANISTAQDLFSLAKYIYNNRSFIFKITTGKLKDSAYGAPSFADLQNFNLLPDQSFKLVGGKVGLTEAAGETQLAVIDMVVKGQTRQIAIVLLGSDDRTKDMQTILSYLKATYQE